MCLWVYGINLTVYGINLTVYVISLSAYGNRTSWNPRPRPAPCLAASPKPELGAKISRIANTAAATTASVKASSRSGVRFGNITAAKATTKPCKTYLTIRLQISRVSADDIL